MRGQHYSSENEPTLMLYERRWLLVASVVQLAISTGHVGVLLARTISAFAFMDGAAREAFLSDERTPLHTAEQALYTFNVRVI